ncbi:dihydrolipoyl dehydrogenase family protein [Denitrobaculum tricleocarpae]|uniref:Dihydrolipoamide dehydrogenase n=1 Tax=Denitrobaculum tricleocarpae TaxID=2591009 RepID=A0A545U207_9PROT|nr:FAD-dependent oxidoreductase [Denitrobaculum tricleocarpae]TQV83486.1 dihydrolipoamide dehydrogenase [Denitrobaculum tricleocarpae]
MSEKQVIKADIAIIGAGSGGLSVAAGAAQMGAKVVLIEKGKMGGDCLNYGCVPSKAMIAAGEAAEMVRTSGKFGVNGHEPAIDFAKVNAHVHDVIGGIAPHDSVERFEGLGVQVIQASGRFISKNEIEAGDFIVKARRFVVSTGSSAFVPPIPGLDEVPYLTNETVFNLTDRPEHLIIVGGGPIGIEMAQAHRRLGAKVTVVEGLSIMGNDDPEAVDVVRQRLIAEGIDIREQAKVESVIREGNGVSVLVSHEGKSERVDGSHLLLAVGRRANVANLGLEEADIDYSPRGIEVDQRLRTSNKRVFAIGDVAGSFQFTHVAGYHAGIVIRNAMFNLPSKVDVKAVPWVTYTDPELAHVGLSEAAAKEQGIEAKAVSFGFDGNDRARAERATDGFIKAVIGKKGKILGATIVGRHAGELILPWVLAVQKGLKASDMAGIIAPYPTLGEVSKRVAGAYYTPALFSDRTKTVVGLMQRLP